MNRVYGTVDEVHGIQCTGFIGFIKTQPLIFRWMALIKKRRGISSFNLSL
jgi:hypothetical protein